ncbi:hypothetical protein ACT691_17960 [Vibrio metschnikovii]
MIKSNPGASGVVGGVVNATTLTINDVIVPETALCVYLGAWANNHDRIPEVSGDYRQQGRHLLLRIRL